MSRVSPLTIQRHHAVLVVIDMQTALAAAMSRKTEVVAATAMLMRAAGVLGIPVITTRQYPEGLGEIVPALADLAHSTAVDKLTFDCMADEGFVSALAGTGKRQVVVCGMEAHICVAQTTLGLLAAGFDAHVVADAVCSRRDLDRDVAFERLRSAGARVTTAEAVVYEALGAAGTGEFKAVLALVKERDASV
ncbi:MAG: isochorismatase family protein [Coriobacteriia bacterium]